MPVNAQTPPTVQLRLTSSVELMRTALEPYVQWITTTIGVSLDETITLEVDTNPADLVAADLLVTLPLDSATKARNRSWHPLVENWSLPNTGISPRVAVSLQRERKPKAAPSSVWELDWQDCPVAFKLRGLERNVVSVQVPLVFPPADSLVAAFSQHWFIAHREDAAKLLLLIQEVQANTDHYLQTTYGRTRLDSIYDWNTVVLDANARRMVANRFRAFL